MLQPFYWNFDGLDVAFQGSIPGALIEQLEAAKLGAQNSRRPFITVWRNEFMHIAESGAPGGFAYRCDTGPVGATWFFGRNQNPENWNIRTSVKSDALASFGYENVRLELYRFLKSIGASIKSASISRVDYCFDFLSGDIEAILGKEFVLDPTAFVMHSHTLRRDDDSDGGFHMNGVSGHFTSVTCGRMPGRQIILYDKSREVVARSKWQWWSHWNHARDKQGLHPLLGNEKIWRIEIRAGKRHLKDTWGISDWSSLDDRLGNMLLAAIGAIRYTIPDASDHHRYRWKTHAIWSAIERVVNARLSGSISGAPAEIVKRVLREALAERTQAQILGLIATWAFANSMQIDDSDISKAVEKMVRRHIRDEPAKFEKSQQRSQQKYHFILGVGNS